MAFRVSTPSKVSVAPSFLPRERRQQILLIIFVVVILATLVVLYFGFWRNEPVSSETESESATGAEEKQTVSPEEVTEKMNFEGKFFKSSFFKDLKVYGDWSLETEEKGRSQPFLPY